LRLVNLLSGTSFIGQVI